MDINFPGMNIQGPAKNIGAQGKVTHSNDAQISGMPGMMSGINMNAMAYNAPNHVDKALTMSNWNSPYSSNPSDCDIPELCPGYGPSMAGAKLEDKQLTLAVCDIPELCPGVGPSMGGFNVKNLNNFSACTIPELCIVGNDVTSLASEEETTNFTDEEIKQFKKTQTFYSGIGISNKDDGSFIDYQKPYFAFTAPAPKAAWVSATTVLCSIGLIGAGYVAVTKKQQRDEESFQVEMA